MNYKNGTQTMARNMEANFYLRMCRFCMEKTSACRDGGIDAFDSGLWWLSMSKYYFDESAKLLDAEES